MGKYVVFGVGRMGRAVVHHLLNDPNTESVSLVDISQASLDSVANELLGFHHKISLHRVDDMSRYELSSILHSNDVCIATCGYGDYVKIAEACISNHVNMVDLGGNRDVVRAQKMFDVEAKAAGVTIIPDCGLAPGMIGILGMLAFKRVQQRGGRSIDINMRVGGLPMNPGSLESNPLQYSMTWSAEGLINEYEIPADELRNGKIIEVKALSDCENVVIKTPWGQELFEAFVTGGGSSNLPFILKDEARNVNYKTLRYRGHCNIMRGIQSLGFFSNETKLANVGLRESLVHAINAMLTSKDNNDMVIARAGARGTLPMGRDAIVIYEIFCEKDHNKNFSAMAQTTGYSAAIVAQLIANGNVELRGVVNGEEAVPGELFVKLLQMTGVEIKETLI